MWCYQNYWMSILLIGENGRVGCHSSFKSELEGQRLKKISQQKYKQDLLKQIQDNSLRRRLQDKKDRELDSYYEKVFYQSVGRQTIEEDHSQPTLPPIDPHRRQTEYSGAYSTNPEEDQNEFLSQRYNRVKTEPYERKEDFNLFSSSVSQRKKELEEELERKLNEVYAAMSHSIKSLDTVADYERISAKMNKLNSKDDIFLPKAKQKREQLKMEQLKMEQLKMEQLKMEQLKMEQLKMDASIYRHPRTYPPTLPPKRLNYEMDWNERYLRGKLAELQRQ